MKSSIKEFTLIELIISVIIISILSIVAVNGYNSYTERAKLAEAVSNIKSIAIANCDYYLEHGYCCLDINALDLEIQGKATTYNGAPARETKYFLYTAGADTTITPMGQAIKKPIGKRYWLLCQYKSDTFVYSVKIFPDITDIEKATIKKWKDFSNAYSTADF